MILSTTVLVVIDRSPMMANTATEIALKETPASSAGSKEHDMIGKNSAQREVYCLIPDQDEHEPRAVETVQFPELRSLEDSKSHEQKPKRHCE